MNSLESNGVRSSKFDDRWAFTSKSTALNYGSIAALAAASRVLKDYDDSLAQECMNIASRVWEEEHSKEPDLFHHGNTTGGALEEEELKATVELLVSTGEEKYAERLRELWPVIEENFSNYGGLATRALPFMDKSFKKSLRLATEKYGDKLAEQR